MNKYNLTPTAYKFITTALLLSFSACDPGGYNSYPPSPYYGGGYSDPYRHDSYESRRDWEHEKREERERRELERERQRLSDERRRLEEEQHRHEAAPPPPPKLNCPPGTHPSTHRCTSDERKRGCKDYGGPNGQGCSNF